MSKFSYKGYATRIAVILVSVFLIVYFLPRENRFGYEYELNRPWKYGQLIASYDFPIAKTDAEIQSEQDSVLRSYQPYFLFDLSVESQKVKALRTDFYQGKMKGVPVSVLPHLSDLLHHIYGMGILSGDAADNLHRQQIANIRTVIGQEATSKSVRDIYTTRTAYEYIMQADTANYPRDMLVRCPVNDYLEPNLTIDSVRSQAMYEDLLSTVSPSSGMVLNGQ